MPIREVRRLRVPTAIAAPSLQALLVRAAVFIAEPNISPAPGESRR